VTCAANSYTLGGTISGLASNGLVLANGSDTLNVAANASNFTVPAPVAYGGSYAVTVQSQPTGLTCSVASGSGTMGTADVGNVAVSCVVKPPVVSTMAGSGSAGSADGIGSAASFNYPTGVAVNAGGTEVYIADLENHTIRKISASGVVTTLAGSGTAGSADGTGTAASFHWPYQLALDASGNVYVSDYKNQKIRKITPAGVVTTLAGSGTAGSADGTGAAAQFNFPAGLAVEPGGTVYVSDYLSHTIRKITPAGVVTTLAGSGSIGNADGIGTAASFCYPVGMAVNGGTLYVADSCNNTIRKVDTTTGLVSTWVGSGSASSNDGNGTAASISSPHALSMDASGNLYASDWAGQKIRQISPAGEVTTLAGTGAVGSSDGTCTAATFSHPTGVAVDANGTVYVADYGNHKIRKITR
jgi:sugar lactone lactonase YvrE